eukprot:s4454_g1.t1
MLATLADLVQAHMFQKLPVAEAMAQDLSNPEAPFWPSEWEKALRDLLKLPFKERQQWQLSATINTPQPQEQWIL